MYSILIKRTSSSENNLRVLKSERPKDLGRTGSKESTNADGDTFRGETLRSGTQQHFSEISGQIKHG